ncbi:hypothetical protein ACET3Z_030731 [Daucus carota]
MQAYAPAHLADKIGRIIQIGKIYMIKNFDVKEYTEKDKFRPVPIDRQIVFTVDTKITDLDESQTFVPKNVFDFFQFSDLKNAAEQVTYLTDVIGIIPKTDKIKDFNNRHGKAQKNIKFKLSDGSRKINVTFWDSFAEEFVKAMTADLEEPVILIIASGRVTKWNEQIDICSYAPTQFYVNYDHHSVHKLRKMSKEPGFGKHILSGKAKTNKLCKISDILQLGENFIKDDVVTKITVQAVQEKSQWMHFVCTSCYETCSIQNQDFYCKSCDRIVPEPNKKFTLEIIGSDETGSIKIKLKDRAFRRLLEGTAFDMEAEHLSFPKEFKVMIGQGYTLKLQISKENIEKNSDLFLAVDMYPGFEYEEPKIQQGYSVQQSDSYTAQPSSSSCHLDDISQLDYTGQ